ncbi:MAG: choice-of-anchor D domain-containing protein [Akkermansiaceae bacterium]
MTIHIKQGFTLLIALAVSSLTNANPLSGPIPFSEIGAKATQDYKGDAIGITLTEKGAHLRAGFQKLEADATTEGLWLVSTEKGDTSRLRLRAENIGRGNNFHTKLPNVGIVSVTEKAVSYTRPGLVEKYSVSMDGVRQDFIIDEKPSGSGDLTVLLGITGAKAEAAAYGVKITLTDSKRELAYSRLLVTDATGKKLSAFMNVTDQGDITLKVVDKDAVYPVCIDPTFSDVDWVSLSPSTVPGVDYSGSSGAFVRAVAIQGSDVYIGGRFTVAGNTPVKNVAKWDGSQWSPLGTSSQNGVDHDVWAIEALSSSEVYVGGVFSRVSDSTGADTIMNRIAKWDDDTQTWSPLGSATQNGATGNVWAITALSATEILVGGQFTSVRDATISFTSANRIAKWDTATQTWSHLGISGQNGTNNNVHAIDVVSSTEIYVGGTFTTVSDSSGTNISANRIAKWNDDTLVWSPLGTPTQNGTASTVWAIDSLSSTEVFVGGQFATVSDSTGTSISASRIAMWNGSSWSPLGTASQNGATGTVFAITAISSTEIYVGGGFGGVKDSVQSNLAVRNMAIWNTTSNIWSSAGGDIQNGTGSTIFAIAVRSSADIYVGGTFNDVADSSNSHQVASKIARWDGNSWSQMPTPNGGLNGVVYALAISGSDLYVGGYFTAIGDMSVNKVAKWNGNQWERLGTASQNGVAATGTVLSIYALSPTEVYVGGSFFWVSDSSNGYKFTERIAKWNDVTKKWSQLGTTNDNGVGNTVYAISALSSSEVYVGGSFSDAEDASSGSIPVSRIAMWNDITKRWSQLGTSSQNGTSGTVYAIHALSSTEIYAGGQFTSVKDATSSNISADRIAKWDGTNWSPFGTSTGNGTNNTVYAIDAISSTEIYVGGQFTSVRDATSSNISANRIAKWDGTNWSPLGTPSQNGTSFHVRAISALSSTEIYVGGEFSSVNDVTSLNIPASRIAKWDGTNWSPLGGGVNQPVRAIASGGAGQLYLGGTFTTAGSDPLLSSRYVVKAFLNGKPKLTVEQPTDSELDAGSASVSFSVDLGNSLTEIFTIKNTGTATLTLSGNPVVTGANPSDFIVDTTATTLVLAPDAETTFDVTFTPSAAGNRTATLSISGDDPVQGTFEVSLIGDALDINVQQPGGNIIADGGSISFGTITKGTIASRSFTIQNPGIGDLTGLGITIDGTDAAAFTVSASPTTPVPSGGSTTFTVDFDPFTGESGSRTATLHITSNVAAKSTYDITLTGTAVLTSTDSDNDGMNDALENELADQGFDWQVQQTAQVAAFLSTNTLFSQTQYDANFTTGQNNVINDPNPFGLYTPSQVQGLHVGYPLLQRDGSGQFKLTIGVKKSTTLLPGSFLPFAMTAPQTSINGDGKLEFIFTPADNAAFFRLEAE